MVDELTVTTPGPATTVAAAAAGDVDALNALVTFGPGRQLVWSR